VFASEELPHVRLRIERVLDTMRPALKEDAGDIEFVSVDEEGIVEIRFLGECAMCSLAIMTLRAGVERLILQGVPGVKRIERVA
jgi:Fe-S cluster biogenesis protein NfuA